MKNSWARSSRNARQRPLLLCVMLLAVLLWRPAPVAAAPEEDVVAPPRRVAVQHLALPLGGVRDDAAMMIVGAALIGLGSVLRRLA